MVGLEVYRGKCPQTSCATYSLELTKLGEEINIKHLMMFAPMFCGLRDTQGCKHRTNAGFLDISYNKTRILITIPSKMGLTKFPCSESSLI